MSVKMPDMLFCKFIYLLDAFAIPLYFLKGLRVEIQVHYSQNYKLQLPYSVFRDYKLKIVQVPVVGL